MTDTIRIFKLITGDTIIAMSDKSFTQNLDDTINLTFPVEVITLYKEAGDDMRERFNLKPWQTLSSADSISINSSVILYMTELKTEYATEYMATVEHFYLGGNADQELEDDDDLPNLISCDTAFSIH
jgi:hypothetical protein|tara:strand:+ start:4464 stop:4844 length:381 start_codon:yes stop_codon:yes gene_type:complete